MKIMPGSATRTLLGIALLMSPTTQLFAARRERVVEAWRPVNYNVALALDDRLTQIAKARAEVMVEVLRDGLTLVDLDFGALPIDGVAVDGKPAQFERTLDLLNVHLPQPAKNGIRLSITVDYHGKPKDGLIFANDKDGRPSITGDNWPNRVHHWIPCLDHPSAKATVTFTVTAPARDVVVANGRIEHVPDSSRTSRVWTYTEGVPIPAYCMVIAVGEYAHLTESIPAVTPLSYYVPQSDGNFAPRGFSPAAPSVKFFSDTVAPYPYEKLALIVGATRYGGMENSSAIVFASTLFDSKRDVLMSRRFEIPERLEDVVAHEIAHQWFGDSVTESTWADLWLSEGFATYFAALFEEKYEGEEAFHDYMRRAAERYFAYERQRNTPIHDTETENLNNLLNPNNYEKGAWVLHMLRSQLGDDAFFRGLREYYNAHKSANASTEDLRAALEKSSGRDLKAFFARWVYGTGHPRYQISFATSEYSGAGGTLSVTLKQTQAGDPFLDPVPIEVISKSGKRRLWIEPKNKDAVAHFHFASSDLPTSVKLDPDDTILKEIISRTQ